MPIAMWQIAPVLDMLLPTEKLRDGKKKYEERETDDRSVSMGRHH